MMMIKFMNCDRLICVRIVITLTMITMMIMIIMMKIMVMVMAILKNRGLTRPMEDSLDSNGKSKWPNGADAINDGFVTA